MVPQLGKYVPQLEELVDDGPNPLATRSSPMYGAESSSSQAGNAHGYGGSGSGTG